MKTGTQHLYIPGPTNVPEAVRRAMAENPQPVADFRNGKVAAKGRLVGATMKLLGGRGEAAVVNRLLDEELRRPQG